jgi:uncharacterized protein (DUF983 family)
MRHTAHRQLIHAALVLLVLVDLLVLASFVFNQWFDVSFWQALGLAGLFALPVTMLVLPLVDAVLAKPKSALEDEFSGDKIPGAGQ